jgi:hypothetical protein
MVLGIASISSIDGLGEPIPRMPDMWQLGRHMPRIVSQRRCSRYIMRNRAGRNWHSVPRGTRGGKEAFRAEVEVCVLQDREGFGRLVGRVLLSSLVVPAILTSSLCVIETPDVAAAGFSESQQKAYDAFVQYGVSPSSTKQGGDADNAAARPVGRARQQQETEKSRISTALDLLARAEENQKQGRYADALDGYQHVIGGYPDLALAERARVKRALMEYQLGKTRDSILHLEDEEVAVRGNAEVHAALAAVLYTERPNELNIAEEQWDIATEFDTRYSSIEFVENNRYWPPAMVSALKKFLLLQR